MVVHQRRGRPLSRNLGRLLLLGCTLYAVTRLRPANVQSSYEGRESFALAASTGKNNTPLPMLPGISFIRKLARSQNFDAKCTRALAQLDPEGAVCGVELNDTCPQHCRDAIDSMEHCVGKRISHDALAMLDLRAKHTIHVSKEAVGVDKFDLTMYMPLLSRSFSLHSTALWLCTFNTTKSVVRFLPKSKEKQNDCDLAVEVFRQSRTSICNRFVNVDACNFQCHSLILELAKRCHGLAFHDRVGKMQYFNDSFVQSYLTSIVASQCEHTLRKEVFQKEQPVVKRRQNTIDASLAPISSAGYMALLLLIGKTLRVKLSCLRALSLPASLIGGFLGMFVLMLLSNCAPGAAEWVRSYWMLGWGQLPGFLINVTFATVFMGVEVPGLAQVWEEAGPQLVFGHVIAIGQYVIGLGLGMLLSSQGVPVPPFYGIVLPAGFSGGHGTAAAFKDGYNFLNWDSGYDTTLMSATIGLVGGMVSGIVLINIMKGIGLLPKGAPATDGHESHATEDDEWDRVGIIPPAGRRPAAFLTTRGEAVDTLAFQASFVFIATFFAYGLKRTLVLIEDGSEALANAKLFSSIPMFPLCMLSGMVVSRVLRAAGCEHLIDRKSMDRVNGLSLDVLVLCAIATMNLSGVLDGLVPLLVLSFAGFAFMVFSMFALAPLMLPKFPHHIALFEYGKCTGSTPIGMLLMKIADPNMPDEVARLIGYKMMLYEPATGLWLTVVILILTNLGTMALFLTSLGIWLGTICFFFVVIYPKVQSRAAKAC
mmetsp:Transcript_67553/g.188484  ORF Transcript_67553/g.188484 Transcript_67553/m.188484 type:complete len:764 (-) Transcript_67553:120-2411(-)